MSLTASEVAAIRARQQGLRPNRRAAGGLRAKRSGDALERAIMFGISNAGNLKIKKLPGIGGRYIAAGRFIGEEMPCDCCGTIVGGRAIYFDCKSVGENDASFRANAASIMKPHQTAFLMDMERMGAVAGVLVESRRTREYLWLAAKHLAGGAPVRWDDARWVRLGGTERHVDFTMLVKEKT